MNENKIYRRIFASFLLRAQIASRRRLESLDVVAAEPSVCWEAAASGESLEEGFSRVPLEIAWRAISRCRRACVRSDSPSRVSASRRSEGSASGPSASRLRPPVFSVRAVRS